jgi:hypothetical protein
VLVDATVLGAVCFVLGTLAVGARHWGRADDRGGEPWLLVWCGALLVTLGGLGEALVVGRWQPAIRAVVVAPLLAPWGLARAVAIPMGWWRASAVLGALSGWTWRGRASDGSIVAASAALARGTNGAGGTASAPHHFSGFPRRSSAEAGRRWVRRRVRRPDAAATLSRAYLAAMDGDWVRAGRLAAAVRDFDPLSAPVVSRELAAEIRLRASFAHRHKGSADPRTALAARWERLAERTQAPARHRLAQALEELRDYGADPRVHQAMHRVAPSLVSTPPDPFADRCVQLRQWMERVERRPSRMAGDLRSDAGWCVPLCPPDRRLDAPAVWELEQWAGLRAEFARARREGRGDSAWVLVRPELERLAVALWLSGDGRELGVALLRWLHDRALEHGDVEAANHARRNLTMVG